MRLVLVGVVAAVVGSGGNAKADFTFGEAMDLGPPFNSPAGDEGLTVSTDGLSIFFGSCRPHGGEWDIWTCTRETTEDEWSPAMNLGPIVNTPQSEGYPSISADGLELFFCSIYWQSQRPGGYGGADLWVTKRASADDDWNEPENLGPVVNSTNHDSEPHISSDGLSLYFASERPGGYGPCNLYVTKRKTKDDPWEEPVNLGPTVNLGSAGTPNLSADGLLLFFTSNRSNGYGKADIWLSRRMTTSDPWGEPINLGPSINNSASQVVSYVPPDGKTLYFRVNKPQYDFMQAPILPIVDLNADGIVDAVDLCIMVDSWGTENPLCDIGPMPWGDGVVDVQDLIVLAEHLFEELPGRPIQP